MDFSPLCSQGGASLEGINEASTRLRHLEPQKQKLQKVYLLHLFTGLKPVVDDLLKHK